MDNVLNEIRKEIERQNFKWGEQNHNPVEWIAILTEEVGEASKEAVDFHFHNPVDKAHTILPNTIEQKNRLQRYRTELIQVAAVAVQMIECVDRNTVS